MSPDFVPPPVFVPLSEAEAAHYRAGGADAYGLPPETATADWAVPCRHTLRLLPPGTPFLIVAHRPFRGLNPYTETGPIFLAAEDMPGAAVSTDLPAFLSSPAYIVRGYGADERILYGTGAVVLTPDIPAACERLLERDEVAFIHIRSASNNCFHVRVERAPPPPPA